MNGAETTFGDIDERIAQLEQVTLQSPPTTTSPSRKRSSPVTPARSPSRSGVPRPLSPFSKSPVVKEEPWHANALHADDHLRELRNEGQTARLARGSMYDEPSYGRHAVEPDGSYRRSSVDYAGEYRRRGQAYRSPGPDPFWLREKQTPVPPLEADERLREGRFGYSHEREGEPFPAEAVTRKIKSVRWEV